MRTLAIFIVTTGLFAQENVEKVLRFAPMENAQNIQEVTTVIRSIVGIRQATADVAEKTVALRGTADQIAMAEWLFDMLAQQDQSQAMREYRVPGNIDDIVRVFFLSHISAGQNLQEVATLVRSITEMRRLFTYNAPKALTVRGTESQIALAEWLIQQLDQPANRQEAAKHEYQLPGGDDIVRVFFLAHAGTPQELQDVAVQVRTSTQVRRLFTYNAPRAMALRGTADQIAMADKLIKERDK